MSETPDRLDPEESAQNAADNLPIRAGTQKDLQDKMASQPLRSFADAVEEPTPAMKDPLLDKGMKEDIDDNKREIDKDTHDNTGKEESEDTGKEESEGTGKEESEDTGKEGDLEKTKDEPEDTGKEGATTKVPL
ncbi:hypothetical protein [Sinomonas sp. G460-2]|uniref:hypothetical protein n=1 Tax=Sinomonas sp. G460-2 TaxID=3393464 RepID=UPI0039EF6613